MTTGRRPRGFWEELFAEVEVEGSVVGVAGRHGVSDRHPRLVVLEVAR